MQELKKKKQKKQKKKTHTKLYEWWFNFLTTFHTFF